MVEFYNDTDVFSRLASTFNQSIEILHLHLRKLKYPGAKIEKVIRHKMREKAI